MFSKGGGQTRRPVRKLIMLYVMYMFYRDMIYFTAVSLMYGKNKQDAFLNLCNHVIKTGLPGSFSTLTSSTQSVC